MIIGWEEKTIKIYEELKDIILKNNISEDVLEN